MNSYPPQPHALSHQLPHDAHRPPLPPLTIDGYRHNHHHHPSHILPPQHLPSMPPIPPQAPPTTYENYGAPPPPPPPDNPGDRQPTAEDMARTQDALVPKSRTDSGRRYACVTFLFYLLPNVSARAGGHAVVAFPTPFPLPKELLVFFLAVHALVICC